MQHSSILEGREVVNMKLIRTSNMEQEVTLGKNVNSYVKTLDRLICDSFHKSSNIKLENSL